MDIPRFTVVAGANGAGKSTLTSGNPDIFDPRNVLDPDAFAIRIYPGFSAASAIAAGRQVLTMAAQRLEFLQSFAVETPLSGKNYLRMMLEARDRGFEIDLLGRRS